jgi:hypothetical protein
MTFLNTDRMYSICGRVTKGPLPHTATRAYQGYACYGSSFRKTAPTDSATYVFRLSRQPAAIRWLEFLSLLISRWGLILRVEIWVLSNGTGFPVGRGRTCLRPVGPTHRVNIHGRFQYCSIRLMTRHTTILCRCDMSTQEPVVRRRGSGRKRANILVKVEGVGLARTTSRRLTVRTGLRRHEAVGTRRHAVAKMCALHHHHRNCSLSARIGASKSYR